MSEQPLESGRSVWQWLADWLAVRRPTRLVVDGLLILLAAGAVYVLWIVWYEMNGNAGLASPSRLDRNLNTLFSLVRTALYYLGLVFVAVGCCRIIADAVRESREPR